MRLEQNRIIPGQLARYNPMNLLPNYGWSKFATDELALAVSPVAAAMLKPFRFLKRVGAGGFFDGGIGQALR
jgi:hypothetical protein